MVKPGYSKVFPPNGLVMGIPARKLATALRAARHSVAVAHSAPLCPHGSYRAYDCSPSGVVMPERITPVEHSDIGDLFAGVCICDGCRATRRSAASSLPPILYHATPEGNVESVLRLGLTIPEPGHKAGSDGVHRDRIFLSRFDDPTYMNLPADKIADAVVLAVDTSYLDPARMYPDDSLYSAYFNDQLSEDEVAVMFPTFHDEWRRQGGSGDFGEWMDENGPDDELESLLAGRYNLTLWGSSSVHELGEVGYEASIPPHAISVHEKKASTTKEWPDRVEWRFIFESILKKNYWPGDDPPDDVFTLMELRTDQLKPMPTDESTVAEYEVSNTKNMPPIVLNEKYLVIDGSHRLTAAQRRGDETIWAYVMNAPALGSIARRILAAAGKEFWQMTQREFMHPKFDVRALDRIAKGKEGESAGTLGDYFRGEKLRALYAPVLDTPVMVLSEPIEGGKRVRMPEGYEFKGALGTFRGEMTIFLPSGTINGLINALLEEGAHAMRESKGRESPETSIADFDWDAYEALPHEQAAAAMSEHALSLKEKNHREFVEEALAAGETVPPEVLADYPELAPDAVAHTAAAGLAALGETIPYDGQLWHGTSLGGAASIARGGFIVQPHGEMSAETVSLSRNSRAAELFAGGDGVVFEFDIRLNRLFVVPEFVYDAMICYRGSGACDEDAERRIMENAAALKRIGALPMEWEGDEPPDWSEWRGSDMNEYDWLEKALPGYDGVVVPGFHNTHPNAEAEIAVFDSVARRLRDSVVMMSVGGEIYSTEGGVGETIEDGWNALGTIDPGEHGMGLDAALHEAAAKVGDAAGRKPIVLYHGTTETGIGQLKAGPGKHQRVTGIYLSKSRVEAEKYTKTDGVKHPENVLTVHAYLDNPATRKVLDELGYKLDGDQMQAELIRRGYDSVIDELMDEVIVFDPGKLTVVNDGPQEVTANTTGSPSGGWSDHWDQGDLRDAVVYAAEIYGDEWGWKWDTESVERQMDEVSLVGFREMDPRDYTDISAFGPLGDPGWMKDEPPGDWSDLLEYEYDRPFGHIVEAWMASRLSPAVFFEDVGEGDGRARALFSYALDMPLMAAVFRYEGRSAACAVALCRAASRIASVGTIVAYHATRAGSAIMQEGFKKSTEVSGGGLGGSSYQGSVSFTTDWEVAKGIHDAFALMHSLVNADDPMKAVVRHFESLEQGVQDTLLKLLEGSFGSEVAMTMQGWRFKYDAFNAMTEDELQEKGFRPKDDATFEKGEKTLYYGWYEPMEKEEKEKIVYNYVSAHGYSESSKYNPVFMGGDSKHFKGIQKSDIGIVTVELNIDPSKKMEHHGESGEGYAVLPAESEYRVTDMSMIGRILDYDSDPGDEPKVQAIEKSYHADDETEEWVNRLLAVFQRNRKALDGSGLSVMLMLSNLRNADDMDGVRRLADSALKAIGMDRMDLSLKSLMRLKELSKPSETARKAMDAMPPEILQRVGRSDDFVQVSEWWAEHDEEAYLQWVDQMYGMGINESSAEFEIDEWIRSRYHAKRFQEELASLSRFADGLNEGNLDNFAEVSKVLYEVVETNPYLRASAALRRARLRVSATDGGYTIQADSEGDHIWAFVFDADGEQVDDAYADVRLGAADDFQDMPGGSYDFFGQDEPIEEEGRVAVLTGLELPGELRGSGLGRQMVEAVTGMAFSAGAQAVYTHAVGGSGPDPTGFYERVGFEKVDMDRSGHYYLRLGPPRSAAAPTVEQIATEARRRLVGDYDLDDDPPKALCMQFAEYLTERLREAGYDAKFVRGTFYLDYPDPEAYEDWDPDDFEGGDEEMEEAKQNALHYWAEVDSTTVVDITADQFDDECDEQFEPITIGSYAELGRYTPQDRR